MGKGDKKSRRGKIHIGTFGKRRRPNKNTFSKPAQAVPVEEKVVKVKTVAPVEEVEQPVVVAPKVVEKPVKAKAKKAETTGASEPEAEKKTVKKAPKKAKETPAKGAE
jgi:ribosomal small subunit protein bTHX